MPVYWANVNFQPIGVPNQRFWQLQGSGFTTLNAVEIGFTTSTPYNIQFEDQLSGIVSTGKDVLDAYQIATINSSTGNEKTIINLRIQTKEPLNQFGFDIFVKDGYWANDDCYCFNSSCSGFFCV